MSSVKLTFEPSQTVHGKEARPKNIIDNLVHYQINFLQREIVLNNKVI